MMARRTQAGPDAHIVAIRRQAPPAARTQAQQSFELDADRAADAVVAGRFAPQHWGIRGSAAAQPSRHAGAGTALDGETRRTMERGFGADFSRVRVHTDDAAADAARRLGALAYADGEHIVFDRNRYRPGDPEGRRLLAHELAHVLQQREGASPPQCQPATTPQVEHRTTFLKDPPPQLSLPQAQKMVNDAVAAGQLHKDGAAAGYSSNIEQAMLLYILVSATRPAPQKPPPRSVEIDIGAPIGLKPARGPAPRGKVSVTVDDRGRWKVSLISRGATAVPPASPNPSVPTNELKSKYGIKDVVNKGATWTAQELNVVLEAFARVPPPDVAVLNGMTLEREVTLPRGDAEYYSEQKIDPRPGGTVTDETGIRFSNAVFADLGLDFVGSAGDESPAAYVPILHEVGHAVEQWAFRDPRSRYAQGSRELFSLVDNKAPEKQKRPLRKKIDQAKAEAAAALMRPELTASAKASGVVATKALSAANSAARRKGAKPDPCQSAAQGAAPALASLAKAVNSSPGNLQSLQQPRTAAKTAVDAAVACSAGTGAAPPQTYGAAIVAQRDWLNALELVMDQGDRTKRLQKFVDFVNANNIQPFTTYAKVNWPSDPGEFFAEAYSLFRTDRKFLLDNYPDLLNWFDKEQYK